MSGSQRYAAEVIGDAALLAALRLTYTQKEAMLSYVAHGTTEPSFAHAPLSDSDVQRIASAVADEMERRASHPLRVTAADVRRWVPS